jgi:LmeA-like phospholipid-binding
MRRGIRILLIAIVVLGGLFVAADRLALVYAQSQAAEKIQSMKGLTDKPNVSIKGFPFLTQVAARDLNEVTVGINNLTASADGASTGGSDLLRVAHFTADLHHVRINGNFAGAAADTVTGTALISYSDLSKAVSGQLSQVVSGITVGYGGTDSSGQGQVKISGTVHVPFLGSEQIGGTLSATVRSGNRVAIKTPAALSRLTGSANLAWPVSGLPTGIQLSSMEAAPDGLRISFTGSDVQLAG